MVHNRYEHSSEDEHVEHGYDYTDEKIARELAELGPETAEEWGE